MSRHLHFYKLLITDDRLMDYQKPVRDQRVVSITTECGDLCLYDPQETNYAKYYRLRRQKENERHQSRSEKLRENPCGQKAPIQQSTTDRLLLQQ